MSFIPDPETAPDPVTQLSAAERAFYARQLILPEIGMAGQLKLKAARVAVLGAGGLGAPALLYLAGAGVGEIIIIDDDSIEISNLHRQVIHTYARSGNSKAESAAETMRALNPFITVTVIRERLTDSNALTLLTGADAVLDGSDNFEARYAVSAAAQQLGIPHIWAAILGFDAQLSVFWPGRGPVYEDLYPQAPAPGSVPSCSTAGIIGALAGVVGSAMAMETIKAITGSGKPLVGEVGLYSGLSGEWKYIPLLANTQALPQKNAESHSERRKEPENRVTFRNNLVFLDTVSEDSTRSDISAAELQDVISRQKVVVIDVRERVEFEAYAIDNAVNFPLTDILSQAREGSLSAKLREKIAPETNLVVIYCTGYTRSVEAAREITPLTQAPVRILSGGISSWLTV